MDSDDCIEADVVFKWTHCCRLCLTDCVEYDLFDPKNDVKCKTLIFNLDLLIYRGDPMPRKLCLTCWAKIESWQEFRSKCLETESSLRKRLVTYRGLDFVQEYLSKDDAIKDTLKSKSPESTTLNENQTKESENDVDSTNSYLFGRPFKKEPVSTEESIVTTNTPQVHVKTERVEATECDTVTETVTTTPPLIKVRMNLGYETETIDNAGDDDQTQVTIKRELDWPIGDFVIPDYKVEPEPLENDVSNDADRAYNLRPRLDTTVNYGEPMEWQNTDTLPKPVQQKITPWKCHACSFYFSAKDAVKLHQSSSQCLGYGLENFTCQVCAKVYFNENDLAEHNLQHLRIAHNLTSDQLRPCSYCKQCFADSKRFSMHQKLHTVRKSVTQLTCCGKNFTKKTIFDNHVASHPTEPKETQDERLYACSLCVEKFAGEDLLYDHRFAVHGIPDERVGCTVCLRKFRTAAALREHSKTHYSVARKSTSLPAVSARIRCRKCGKRFSTREHLLRHDADVHKKLHNCRKCKRRFPTRSLLLMHARTHTKKSTGFRIFEDGTTGSQAPDPKMAANFQICSMCVLHFEHKEDITFHIQTHSVTDISPGRIRHSLDRDYRYQCSQCPQLFTDATRKNRHSSYRHYGAHIAFIEMKGWARRTGETSAVANKNVPVASASVSVTYPCSKCPIKFSSLAVLNFHLKKRHNETGAEPDTEKTFVKCKICSRSYSSSYIGKHMTYDHGIKANAKKSQKQAESSCYLFAKKRILKCKYCDRTCSTSYNLQRHESSHDVATGNFKCNCGALFKDQALLYDHKKRCGRQKDRQPVTPKPVAVSAPRLDETCNVCFQSYESPQLLQLHVSTAHGLGVPTENPSKELWREERNKIIRKVNGELRCTLCRLRFDNNEEVSWHQGQHARGNAYIIQLDECLFQCTVCGKLFKQREDGLNHISAHAEPSVSTTTATKGQNYNCPFCSSRFSTEESIRRHINYQHPGGSSTNSM